MSGWAVTRPECSLEADRIILGTMTPVVHQVFRCPCGEPTILPLDGLKSLLSDLVGRSIDSAAIGVVCPRCKRAGMHFLEIQKDGSSQQDRTLLQEPFENIVTRCAAMMRCEERTCPLPLLLVIPVNREISDKAFLAHRSKWNFSELVCPNGHPILKPTSW